MRPGFAAVVHRELRRLAKRRIHRWLGLYLPILGFSLLAAEFWNLSPQDLPIAYVDLDGSKLSRQLGRMLDETQGLRVSYVIHDPAVAQDLVLRGKVYGYAVAPRDMERDVLRGRPQPVVCYHNAVLLTAGGVVRRHMRSAVNTLSAGLELRFRQSRQDSPATARARLNPIAFEGRTLFNPELDYGFFVLVTLFPALLQIFAIVTAIEAVGSELKEGSAGEWMATAGGRTAAALFGKMLPHAALFTLLGTVMFGLLHGVMGFPFRGSVAPVALSTLLLVLAQFSVGVALAAWLANLGQAGVLGGLYAGPAFAFVGATFPRFAMPPAAQAYGWLLPLTYHVRIVLDQTVRGSAVSASAPDLLVLLAFVLVPLSLSWRRLSRVSRDLRFWGAE